MRSNLSLLLCRFYLKNEQKLQIRKHNTKVAFKRTINIEKGFTYLMILL